jgi:hypothetical protein
LPKVKMPPSDATSRYPAIGFTARQGARTGTVSGGEFPSCMRATNSLRAHDVPL